MTDRFVRDPGWMRMGEQQSREDPSCRRLDQGSALGQEVLKRTRQGDLGETAYVTRLMLDNDSPLRVPTSRAVFDGLVGRLTQDLPAPTMALVIKAYGHLPAIADMVVQAHADKLLTDGTKQVLKLRLADLTAALHALDTFVMAS
jgi:hypothetical protein